MCVECKNAIRAGEAYIYEANELCYTCYRKWVAIDERSLTASLMRYREGRV